MGFLEYIAKGLLIFAGACGGFAVVSFASMGYTEIALLFLVTLLIPVSMIVYEYWKSREK